MSKVFTPKVENVSVFDSVHFDTLDELLAMREVIHHSKGPLFKQFSINRVMAAYIGEPADMLIAERIDGTYSVVGFVTRSNDLGLPAFVPLHVGEV